MSSCAGCGHWKSRVLETRKDTAYGYTWRLRQCDSCGVRWPTYELPVECITLGEPSNPDGRLHRR